MLCDKLIALLLKGFIRNLVTTRLGIGSGLNQTNSDLAFSGIRIQSTPLKFQNEVIVKPSDPKPILYNDSLTQTQQVP